MNDARPCEKTLRVFVSSPAPRPESHPEPFEPPEPLMVVENTFLRSNSHCYRGNRAGIAGGEWGPVRGGGGHRRA